MKTQIQRTLLRASMVIIVAISLIAVVYVVMKPSLHHADSGPRDVGDCVARALIQKLTVGEDKAAEIGAKIKDATDANVGIKSKDTLEIIRQTLSDPVQAYIVNVCARQYNASPLYNPVVKVIEHDSQEAIQGVTLRASSDFERCETDSAGVCRLLLTSGRVGQKYTVDATCDHQCTGYSPHSEQFDEQAVAGGEPLTISLDPDTSTLAFDIVQDGRGLTGIVVEPDVDIPFRSESCQRANLRADDCRRVVTVGGLARFHFARRPKEVPITLTLPSGKQLTKEISVPENGMRILIKLDALDGSIHRTQVCRVDGDAPPSLWTGRCAAPVIQQGDAITKRYIARFPQLQCSKIVEYRCP